MDSYTRTNSKVKESIHKHIGVNIISGAEERRVHFMEKVRKNAVLGWWSAGGRLAEVHNDTTMI